MSYWTTIHWPVPPTARPPLSRHVYVKRDWNYGKLPEEGDMVFVYESETATIDRKRVREVEWWTGLTPTGEIFNLPDGAGGLIGKMKVNGTARKISSQDVVGDYGNLKDEKDFVWRVVPCHGWEPIDPPLPRPNLMEAICKPPKTPPRFLHLWRVRDELVPGLLRAVDEHLRG